MKISTRAQIYLVFLRAFEELPVMPAFLSGLGFAVKSLWQAVWLGWLDTNALNEITWSYYIGRSGFEADDFNIHQGLWSWEADAIHTSFKDRKRVLVGGAGGGREVIALAQLGYDVTAFDFSSRLTSACRQNLEKTGCVARVLDAPPDALPEGLDTYDALLIGRGFYHHIPSRARRVAFLGACRRHLNVGAPVLLSDFFTRPGDSRNFWWTQTVANTIRWLRRDRERVELGDWLSTCLQHAFVRDEIELEFREGGIQLEAFTVSPFSEDSRLAHAIGRVRFDIAPNS